MIDTIITIMLVYGILCCGLWGKDLPSWPTVILAALMSLQFIL